MKTTVVVTSAQELADRIVAAGYIPQNLILVSKPLDLIPVSKLPEKQVFREPSIRRLAAIMPFLMGLPVAKRDNTVCNGCGGKMPPGRAGRKCKACR